jgi:hypothetical protein
MYKPNEVEEWPSLDECHREETIPSRQTPYEPAPNKPNQVTRIKREIRETITSGGCSFEDSFTSLSITTVSFLGDPLQTLTNPSTLGDTKNGDIRESARNKNNDLRVLGVS